MRFLTLTAALLVSAAASGAPNLVPNGDFEAGNTGFTTDYILNTASGIPEGVYDVRTDGGPPYHPSWATYGDHTTGSGLYYIGNGSSDTTDIVWQNAAPIAITAGTSYFFEAFLSNICCNSTFTGPNAQPALTFSVSLDGGTTFTPLDSLTIPVNSTGIWYGLSTTFSSGTATSAILRLTNAQDALSGNDFGLDDIFLGEQSSVVPAPGAIALFGLGIGLLGLARRRG